MSMDIVRKESNWNMSNSLVHDNLPRMAEASQKMVVEEPYSEQRLEQLVLHILQVQVLGKDLIERC
jgi:hypothetical protein